MIKMSHAFSHSDSYPADSLGGRRIASILLVVGLFILLVSLLFTLHYVLIQDELVEVDAVVAHVGSAKYSKAYVSYEYDGETYEMVPYGSWHPGLFEGASITVKIRPDNPGKTVSNISIFFLLVALIYTGFTSVIWFKSHFPQRTQTTPAVPTQNRDRPFGTNW